MYRIRLHGRGGQGIKTAGQIIGSAFFFSGFEAQDAPEYGAERRGAPVLAYVRAARTPIHERGLITRPDLVVVGDESLMPVPAARVLLGVSPHTVLLVLSADPPEVWKDRLKLPGPVLTLAANADTEDERLAPVLIGMTCAGAAARLVGVIERPSFEQAVRAELRAREPAVAERSLERAFAAFEALSPHTGVVREGRAISAEDYERPEWIDLPLEDASLAAPDIHAAQTSVLVNTGVWRTLRPVIEYQRCNRCSWVCSTLCPDSAIEVDPDHTPRIDYDHCKGCMICVAVCPPHAIHAIPEREARGQS